ncbi:MAG TPA: aminodeoxychorismate lyase [Steroidobacteraceae bacterium]
MNGVSPASQASAPEIVLINGVAWSAGAVGISPYDRGLQFGDGLFETIACRDHRPRLLDFHLERLAHGCARLLFATTDLSVVSDEVQMLARSAQNSLIKVMLTRGVATARGYSPSGREKPTRVTFRYPWPHENPAWSQDGVRVRTAALRVGENPALAGVKHLNRLEEILAKAESNDADVAEALLYSSSGLLVSGTMSNVFLVRNSRVQTPSLDRFGIAGVMRRQVLTEAEKAGVSVEIRDLRAEDVAAADEMFFTNARIGIWPARELDGRPFRVGPVTRGLQQALAPTLAGSAR